MANVMAKVLQNIYISNKCCSAEFFYSSKNPEFFFITFSINALSSKMVFNIDNTKKCFFS